MGMERNNSLSGSDFSIIHSPSIEPYSSNPSLIAGNSSKIEGLNRDSGSKFENSDSPLPYSGSRRSENMVPNTEQSSSFATAIQHDVVANSLRDPLTGAVGSGIQGTEGFTTATAPAVRKLWKVNQNLLTELNEERQKSATLELQVRKLRSQLNELRLEHSMMVTSMHNSELPVSVPAQNGPGAVETRSDPSDTSEVEQLKALLAFALANLKQCKEQLVQSNELLLSRVQTRDSVQSVAVSTDPISSVYDGDDIADLNVPNSCNPPPPRPVDAVVSTQEYGTLSSASSMTLPPPVGGSDSGIAASSEDNSSPLPHTASPDHSEDTLANDNESSFDIREETDSRDEERMCPVCKQMFGMDAGRLAECQAEFETHVDLHFEQEDNHPRHHEDEPEIVEAPQQPVCPVCAITFPLTINNSMFESHVHAHFGGYPD